MANRREVLLDLIDAVFAVNGGVLRTGNLMGRQVGLTSAQWQVVGLLEHGPDTVASMARRRGLRRQSVQESADRLLASGFVERATNPSDRRAPLLVLTPAGEAALAAASRASDAWLREFGSEIADADLATCLHVLTVLRAELGVPPRDTSHREEDA